MSITNKDFLVQPSYIDRVNATRQTAAQRQAEQDKLGTMVSELRKMQMAAMMGQSKPSVVLTDQTDLGDAMREQTETIAAVLMNLDRDGMEERELAALKDIEVAVEALQRGHMSAIDTLIDAVNNIDVKPVIQVAAPKVTVQERPVDFTPLQDTFKEYFSKEEGGLDLSCYRAQDLKDDGDIQYVGFVNAEGKWYIIENDTKKNAMRYLFGSSDYASHFKKAASYKYKLLNEAIDAAS